MIQISKQEIKVICDYIYNICGVKLDSTKEYLIKTRLDHIVKKFECASYSELYYKAKTDKTKKINTEIINSITTAETFFFRDSHPFEILKEKILPDLLHKKKSTLMSSLKIWSAASSTGQEIYSIAMIVKELIQDKNIKVNLFATDISNTVLENAKKGIYNKFEITRGLPPEKLKKYFTELDNYWQIKDEIKKMVVFQQRNLMDPFFNIGKFDVVFCRNVAIYFTLEDRKKLFDKIADVIEPNGYLMIGSSEFLTGISPRFEARRFQKTVYYQKKE